MAIPKSVGFPAMLLAAVAVVSPSSVFAQAPVRVGGDIKPPVRTEYVAPVYPPIAQQAKIQGTVVLEIVIGPTGAVTEARSLRQNPLLDAAAVDAVRKWKYTPTLLNGAAVPVIMTVTLNFDLGKDRQSPVIIEATINKDGSVRDTRVINIPPAEIAQPLRQVVAAPADPQVIVVPAGYAIVDVTVGKDGMVREAKLIKGDEKLAAAALDAVRLWRYQPTLLNGVPIEVKMTVLVPIKSSGR
jgi:TonB family protein